MSVGRISFWQQNQNYWSRSASSGQSVALRNVVITSMFGASTNLSRGLASIANQTALNRVNSQLTAAVQNALASIGGGSTSAGGSTASSSSSGATASPSSSSANSSAASSGARAAAPATGTGTAPLTAGTSLATLGILKNGTITVSDGTNTTIYKSTGSDTVSDLVSALNRNVYGNAQVAAWLNASGKLVISGKNNTAMITVGGTNAANVGFVTGHAFFQPTTPSPSTAGSSKQPVFELVRRLDFKRVDIGQQRVKRFGRESSAKRGAWIADHRHRRDIAGQQRTERQPGQSAGLIGQAAAPTNCDARSPRNVIGPTWHSMLLRSAQISPPMSVQRLQKAKSSLR